MKKIPWLIRALVYKIFLWNMGGVVYLGRPLYLKGLRYIQFGHKFRIYPHARIEVATDARCKFGDNSAIGDNLHLICERRVIIGNDFLCSSNVFISDTDHSFILDDVPFINQPCVSAETIIGNNVFLGKNVVVLAGARLGNNTVVAANAVVKGHFPDNVMIGGIPAKIIRSL
ncbi:acyltransferase [Enterobacteriaceae bacterium BIT-l23]|uniref:DapH/DapD/GlmU-related protein n=1 Tax=Jejubacter sp. L23 TaxID=3092086 RepID=UPI001584589E|nr:acyltransferase [Enterobacteriaceae bacterium BIT-l23]